MKPRIDPPTPTERVVLFGGPLLFIAIVVIAWKMLLGPTVKPNPVKLLREGAVAVGEPMSALLDRIGPPNHELTDAQGRRTWNYETTTWSAELKAVIAEDADVTIEEDGRVGAINFSSKKVDQTPDEKR